MPITLKGLLGNSRCRIAIAVTILGASLACTPALAASPAVPPPQIFFSNIGPLTDTISRVEADPRPKTADGALPVLDWLFYANLSTGAAYDSNYFSASTNPTSVYGARFQPSLIAERNTGIQRTTVYGVGDIRYYPSLGRTSIVDTTGGLVHVWEIDRELVFRTQGQISRGEENSGLTGLLSGPTIFAVEPVKYTKLFGSASIDKSFGSFFTAVGGSVTRLFYENSRDIAGNTIDEHYRNGNITTLNARFGYHISPIVYVYTEPSVNAAQYTRTGLNSNGYQVQFGVGSARIGLMNGELYSGFRKQHFSDPNLSDLNGALYGGRLSYFPTRFITIVASVDQTLGTSDFGASNLSPGTVTNTNSARISTSWEATRKLTFNNKLEFAKIDYINAFRTDNVRRIGFGLSYMITDLFGLTIDFTSQRVDSNLSNAAFTRNFIGMGGVSKF